MTPQPTILARILERTRADLERDKMECPLDELKAMIPDAPPRRSLAERLESGFGLIAEIKERSPSKGEMRPENVAIAAEAYEASPAVLAFSVLTDRPYFGMSVERMQAIKATSTKPVLRKDFIVDPYQVYEAKAFGADVILLMAQRLDQETLKRLHDLADELELEVLMEVRELELLARIPEQTSIIGINSRQLLDSGDAFEKSKAEKGAKDFSTDLEVFRQIDHLPAGCLKVAESGIHPHNIVEKVRNLGFDAALVGTSLLLDERGVEASLSDFERSLGV